MDTTITIAPHPLLNAYAFTSQFNAPAGQITSPGWLLALLHAGADAPLRGSDELRRAVRDLLRYGGYKPTGRGKPASEYLLRAAGEEALGSINIAVDICNVVSLHSGIPISLVDLDRTEGPLHIGIAPEGASYIFNSSGQEIDLAGLLCLFDANGPCANAVKDSQRTKTSTETTRTLSIIWSPVQTAEQGALAERWYRQLVEQLVGTTHTAQLQPHAGA